MPAQTVSLSWLGHRSPLYLNPHVYAQHTTQCSQVWSRFVLSQGYALCLQPNVSLTALQAVAGLSALTELHLSCFSQGGPQMPGCMELACLRSMSLRDLSLYLDQVQRVPRTGLHPFSRFNRTG